MTEPKTLPELLEQPDLATALEDHRTRFLFNPAKLERTNHAALIDAMLDGTAGYALIDAIDRAFVDPQNKAEHKILAGLAETNALLARIVDETATVYDSPATRTVSSGQEQFDALSESLALDLVMRGACQRLVAHEAVLLCPRVRDGEPVLDVVTPAAFHAVYPSSDPTKLVALTFDVPRGPKAKSSDPHYRVCTPWQTLLLNAKGELLSIEDSETPGYLPGVLVNLEPPSVSGRLLPERANHDIVSAETACNLQNVIGLRESIGVQKQAYVTGDTSSTALGQSASSQREIFLGEGVSVTAVDRSVDVERYYRTADAIADTTSANHGLSPLGRKLASATSGFELWLRAAPLVRRRRALIDVLRGGERRLAEQLARVIEAASLDAYRFTAAPFAIRFGELSMPASEAEQLQLAETKRRLGWENTQDQIADREQISDEQAADRLAENIEREAARIELMQALAKQNAGASTPVGDASNMSREAAPAIAAEE